MNINCCICNLYLGEVRDATLRKNVAHICKDCLQKVRSANKRKRNSDDMLPPEFKSIFGL